jgi:N-acetylglucosamine-6-phosphate deacetylase
MKTLIKDATLILKDGYLENGYVVCEDGVIKAVGSGVYPEADYSEIISANGNYLAPGFVDIHVHGGVGHEFIDGTEEAFTEILRAHHKGGTTTILPTFSSATLDTYRKVIPFYNEYKDREDSIKGIPHLAGIHMEGPYFAPAQAGAQIPGIIRNPIREEYEEILNMTPHILRWSVACELEGALEMGDVLEKRGISVSIGHSDATTDQAEEAIAPGYSSVTHLYSSCSIVHRNAPFREGGLVEAAFLRDELDVEIIGDGAHLPRELLQLIYKIKGSDKIALVTDCIRYGGKHYEEGEKVYDPICDHWLTIERNVAVMPDRSCFAGSLSTTSHLVRTMVKLTPAPLYEAVKMASLIPAKIVGLDKQIGSIEEGKKGDFVILDKDLQVKTVILDGEISIEN